MERGEGKNEAGTLPTLPSLSERLKQDTYHRASIFHIFRGLGQGMLDFRPFRSIVRAKNSPISAKNDDFQQQRMRSILCLKNLN